MRSIWESISRRPFWRDEYGQELIEYALMAGLVVVAGGTAFPPVATSVSTIFSKIGSILTAAG